MAWPFQRCSLSVGIAQRLAVAPAHPGEQHERRQQPMEKARGEVPRAHFARCIHGPVSLRHASHHVRGRARSLSAHCLGLRYSLWQPPQLDTTFGHSALNVASSLMAPAAALASAASLSKRANRSAFFSKAAGSVSVSPVLVSSPNRPLALTAVSSNRLQGRLHLGQLERRVALAHGAWSLGCAAERLHGLLARSDARCILCPNGRCTDGESGHNGHDTKHMFPPGPSNGRAQTVPQLVQELSVRARPIPREMLARAFTIPGGWGL